MLSFICCNNANLLYIDLITRTLRITLSVKFHTVKSIMPILYHTVYSVHTQYDARPRTHPFS